MATPKKRTTKSRRDKRRQHIFLKKPSLSKCPQCGHFFLPHTVCSFCGYYNGKKVIDVLEKMEEKEKKEREKEIKKQEPSPKRPLSWKRLSRK